MKSRLAASVSPLFVGEWRRRASKSISLTSKFALSNGKCQNLSSFPCQGLEYSGRAVHSSSIEDDFSELGPHVAGNMPTQLKLLTEKPEPGVKTDPAGKASMNNKCRPSLKDIFLTFNNSSETSSFKLQDQNDASTFASKQKSSLKMKSRTVVNHKNSKKIDGSCSVSIENVPSTVGLSDLVQAVSVFGKVSSACIRSVPDGLDCCNVDFENSESSMRAILAGGITLQNLHLSIRSLHSSERVIIRIQGIGKETTDPTIHSICESIGALEGLAKAGKDVVDAFFRVKKDEDLQRILKRLNNTMIDDCYWSAYQLPNHSSSRAMSEKEDSKSELALQVNSHLVELKKQLDYKKVYFEDLQLLHLGILHLEGLPPICDPFHLD